MVVLVNPICHDERNISLHTCSLSTGAIVSVTSDDTTGFIQCIAEDDNSYETPISVGSVAVPETKCAPFESLLSGDLEEDIQECSDNPHQQSSHFDVTHDSFTDNLVNSFQTTEAHVKPPGLQTDLKEDIATLRDVSSKPAADGEFGGADITVFVSSISNTAYATNIFFCSFT